MSMTIRTLRTGSVLRYAAVGLVNTAVGYTVILGLQLGLGLAAHAANLGGFLVGWIVGYLLSRRYAFRSRRAHAESLPMYALGGALCWGVNAAVLYLFSSVLATAPPVAQAAAMASYSVAFYLWNRYVVFLDGI